MMKPIHPLAVVTTEPVRIPLLPVEDVPAALVLAVYEGEAEIEALPAGGTAVAFGDLVATLPPATPWLHLRALAEVDYQEAYRRAGRRSLLGEQIAERQAAAAEGVRDALRADVEQLVEDWIDQFVIHIGGRAITVQLRDEHGAQPEADAHDDAAEAARRQLVDRLMPIARAPGVGAVLAAHSSALPTAARAALERLIAPAAEIDELEQAALDAHQAWSRRLEDELVKAGLVAIEAGDDVWRDAEARALYDRLVPAVRRQLRSQAMVHIQRMSASGKSPAGWRPRSG